MRRRVLFLRGKNQSDQRNRVAEISQRMHDQGWNCTSSDHPTFGRYDIIWITNSGLVTTIQSTGYRLLVWDKTCDESIHPLLAEIANLTIEPDGAIVYHRREFVSDLDQVVCVELAEEVEEIMGGLDGRDGKQAVEGVSS